MFLPEDITEGWSEWWTEIDIQACHASHNRVGPPWSRFQEQRLRHEAYQLLRGRDLLKMAAPEARQLRRMMLSAIASIDSHWRSVSIMTKQQTERYASLPSGLHWTFTKNTVQAMRASLGVWKRASDWR